MPKTIKYFLCLILVISFYVSSGRLALASDYYIDASAGNDAAAGSSPASAWKTLKKVYDEFGNATFKGGDKILFKRGEEWRPVNNARLYVRNVANTSEENPLYIGAYGDTTDPKPRLDGRNLMGTPILLGSEIIESADKTLSPFANPIHHVIVEDLTIAGADSSDVNLRGVNNWTLRRLQLGDGEDNYGLTFSSRRSSYITIEDCEITASGDNGGETIYIGNAHSTDDQPHHFIIRRNHIYGRGPLRPREEENNHQEQHEGIDLKPGTHHFTIEDNTFTGLSTSAITIRGNDHVIRNNVVQGVGAIADPIPSKTGYGLKTSYFYSSEGNRTVIEGNLVQDVTVGIHVSNAADHVIKNNTVANFYNRGIRAKGSNIELKNNLIVNGVTDSSIGISFGSGSFDANYNSFHQVSTPFENGSMGEHSFIANPQFVNDQYHISHNSPCYQTGENGVSIGYFEPDDQNLTATPAPGPQCHQLKVFIQQDSGFEEVLLGDIVSLNDQLSFKCLVDDLNQNEVVRFRVCEPISGQDCQFNEAILNHNQGGNDSNVYTVTQSGDFIAQCAICTTDGGLEMCSWE